MRVPLLVRTAYRSLVYDPPPDALDLVLFAPFVPEGCYWQPPGPGAGVNGWRAAVLGRMREHYQAQRVWWDELLARPTVALICNCRTPDGCVRVVLAEALEKLGAVYQGEELPIPPPPFVLPPLPARRSADRRRR